MTVCHIPSEVRTVVVAVVVAISVVEIDGIGVGYPSSRPVRFL